MRAEGDLDEVRVVNVLMHREPTVSEGLSLDSRMLHLRPIVKRILQQFGVRWVEVDARGLIHGHSHEMALVMAAAGYPGIYSGMVDTWDGSVITFTPAEGNVTKKAAVPRLITPHSVKSISVSNHVRDEGYLS